MFFFLDSFGVGFFLCFFWEVAGCGRGRGASLPSRGKIRNSCFLFFSLFFLRSVSLVSFLFSFHFSRGKIAPPLVFETHGILHFYLKIHPIWGFLIVFCFVFLFYFVYVKFSLFQR